MAECPCPDLSAASGCSKESLAVTVGGMHIDEFCQKSVTEALDFVDAAGPAHRAAR